jgi:hypothetical protein
MSSQISHHVHKKGTADEHATYMGPIGEITVDTDNVTAVIQDGVTPGGHPLAKVGTEFVRVSYVTFRAAVSQRNTAALGFSVLSSNSPRPISIIGTNIVLGAAAFDPQAVQSVQDHFILPPDWSQPLDVEIAWSTPGVTGTVDWQMELAGMNPVVLDPPFNPPSILTCDAGVVPNEIVTHTITGLDCTEVVPGHGVFFRLTRLYSGTLTEPANLLWLRFLIRRVSV